MGIKLLSPRCEARECPNRTRYRPRLFDDRGRILFEGRRHCSAECFARSVEVTIARLLPTLEPPHRHKHRVPLGLLMLQQGLVEEAALKAALRAQRQAGRGRLGEWLRRLGGASESQVTAGLGLQWTCPVFPLHQSRRFLQCTEMAPLPILESSRMVPAHFLAASRVLYVAFADRIDASALYALERMHDCRTQPCFADESLLDAALEEIRARPRPWETCFDSLHDPGEMARAARGHAASLDAREARLVACGRFIWMRIMGRRQETHLVFKVPGHVGADS